MSGGHWMALALGLVAGAFVANWMRNGKGVS